MPNRFLLLYAFLTFFQILSIVCYSNEIDFDKNEALFQKMFGDEYNKVIATPTKTDDEKFALDLIAGAEAINSNPELQFYLKFKAAEILISSDKNKKKSRDLFIETKPVLPIFITKEVDKKIFDLQKTILNSTPVSNKMLYAEEVEFFISQAQVLTATYLADADFASALTTLKETLRYIKYVDKDAANEINKNIMNIQKDANRFIQIQILLKRLALDPKDEKANLEVVEYYLLERNNLFKAWPYLNNLIDETYSHFFHDIKKCIADEQKITTDGISMELLPLLSSNSEFLLGWLNTKDIVDPEGIIKNQIILLESKKNLQIEKIKTVIQNTVNKNGEMQDVPYKTYLSLAELFDVISLDVQQNKKINAENIKTFKERLLGNKYIALMKANLKIAKVTVDEVDKLKLELELGKTKNALKELKIEEFPVTIATPFLFQQNDFMFDKISVNSEGLYSFDPNSWLQFNKDFEILINNNPFDIKDKKSLLAQDGVLVFNEKKSYFLKSKKRTWGQNTEVSFEVLKDYDPISQGLDFYILFKPDSVAYTKIFAVHYHLFQRGGWFGVMQEGEGWDAFCANKFQKKLNTDEERNSFWKSDRAKISAIVKDKKFEVTIDGETVISFPISEISKEKNFPNTPIQIFFARRGSPPIPLPVKIDNLYIGPARPAKK